MSFLVPEGARLLRGRIRNYRVARTTDAFFLSDFDRNATGLAAVAAAAAGMSGMGAGLMSLGGEEEEADLVEFTLDGGERVQGFVWQSPFKEGDEVEVVAQQMGDVWKAFGIARPGDRIVALHPHCSRGRKAHWRAVFPCWWKASFSVAFIGTLVAVITRYYSSDLVVSGTTVFLFFMGPVAAGVFMIFGWIAWSIGRKLRPFVQMAEEIFRGFGWRDVEWIDLYKLSRRNRKSDDPVELGAFYHRY